MASSKKYRMESVSKALRAADRMKEQIVGKIISYSQKFWSYTVVVINSTYDEKSTS
jgi:hypothetical protein